MNSRIIHLPIGCIDFSETYVTFIVHKNTAINVSSCVMFTSFQLAATANASRRSLLFFCEMTADYYVFLLRTEKKNSAKY